MINFIALQPVDMLKRLKKHIRITNNLYIDLLVTFHKNKLGGHCIDFYMVAACWFIGKPALLVQPMLNPKYQNGRNPPQFFYNKQYSFEEDSYIGVDKIHLRFTVNSINYCTAFFEQSVVPIITTGDPVLNNIIQASKSLLNFFRLYVFLC